MEKSLEEYVKEFLERGGEIKTYRSRADEIAASQIPTGKYCRQDAYIKELQKRKTSWKKERIRKQLLYQNPTATDPGGRIEPGRLHKPWPNRKKTPTSRPVATDGGA